jgi:hypothetical protein
MEFEDVTGVGLGLDLSELVIDRWGCLQTDARSLLDSQFGLGQRHFRRGLGLKRFEELDTDRAEAEMKEADRGLTGTEETEMWETEPKEADRGETET